MLPRHFLLALLLLVLSGSGRVVGQGGGDPRISVNVLSNRVALGEIGQLIIKVVNSDAQVPRTVEAPGLDVIFSGEQSSIKITNGVRSAETNYFYRFRGNSPGTYIIPAFEIRIENEPVMTSPVEITIYERERNEGGLDATKPYFGKLELTKEEFYVNEIVPFTLNAYVRGRGAISDVTQAKLENGSFVIKSFREVRTDGAEVGDVYYSSAVIPSTLFALKPGEYRLGPAEIGVRAVDPELGFGLPLRFRSTTLREMVTNTVNVTVKPLPDNAPTSFTGGVGVFEIAATASTTTVAVGDPISMEFFVSGIGNLRTMGAPEFGIPQTGIWKSYEANKELDDETDSDGFNKGKVKFSRVIIPEAKVDAIPSFLLSYFDPAKAEYVTLRTDPIPLTVTRDQGAESPAAMRFSPAEAESGTSPAADKPTPAFQDILHIRKGTPRWVARADGDSPGPVFYLVQALFLAAFCTVAGFGVARWSKAWRAGRLHRRTHPTYARAVKQLPRPGAPRREFYEAVSLALAQWKREHPRPAPEIVRAVDHLAERCANVLYSGMNEPDSPVSASETAECQAILHKLPRR
ncbi:MAG: protein BatD [Verrucomicrobiaceae bacterium]|nr:protein BatD [Verrucomicrobiaceae bacterium]